MSRRSHMVRCEADPSELAALVDRDWLAAWEDLEGGYVGFLGDVDAAWDVANAEHEGEWSDALSAMQLRLCTIKSALLSVEQAVSAQTRAAAVRLGVRGQRAAAASVGAIGDRWQRNLAIEALLPELDDRGFDLLLHALEPQRGTSLPVIAIAERLLDAGLADEARAWILEDERVRGAAIVSLIDRFDDPEPFRTAVRADLETLPDAPPEARPEGYAVMAAVLAEEERSEWLARAAAMIDEIGDENLWWDSYYGECDLRLTLVEAFIAAGQVDDARGWLDRVREDPAPFADGDSKLSIHFVEVCALLGEVPDGVLDDVDDVDRARWVLFVLGLADRAAVAESVMRMEGPALQAVFEFGDEEMCAIAARRVVELLDAYVADPDSYDAAYAFYEGADAALGAAGPYLPADERLSVLERAWSAFRVPEQPLSLYNSLNAVLGLLAATDPEPRRAIADEVMAAALSQPATLECPPLCDFASWWDAFDGGHTDYVEHVLGQKRVGRPTDWVKYLAALDEPAAALDLARLEGLTDEYGELAARCGRWEEVAQEAIATFESGEFGVWPLWHVVRHAPTPEDAARIARHAWAVGMEDIAEMGCAGDLLNALPEDEAEEVAAEILDADLMIHIFGGQLAPKARLRWVTEQLDEAETLFDRARVVQQLSRLEDDTTRQLVAEVYEAAIADLEGEGLAALQPIVRQLSLEQLEPILDALYEEPSMDLRTSVSYRLQELGAPELARWGATETEIAQLGANLRLAQTLDDVVSALADMPNATTYPWVGELIVGAGIGAEWAEHIGTLDNPSDRLVAWKHVWEHLADEEQERLWDRVHAAIDAERVGTRKARTSWFERMPREDVRRHFRLEMASLRTSSVPFVPTMYSGPLGLAAEHGRTVAGVVRWFTE